MDIASPNNDPRDVKQLLAENQQLLLLILRNTEKTRKYVMWGRVMSAVYLLLILGSIILAAVALPPLFEQAVGPYRELLGSPNGKGEANQDLFNQVQGLLQEYGN